LWKKVSGENKFIFRHEVPLRHPVKNMELKVIDRMEVKM
jgi:hypothetical protein